MSVSYTITTNFGAKDTLPSGDPDKTVQGAEFTTEFNAIKTAFTLAAPTSNPTFTGTATFTNIATTTLSGTLTGNVTGDITGNVTGNITGDITGDLTGNVTGNVAGEVTGNASTASAWATPRTITFTGDATGSYVVDGSTNETCALTVSATGHTHSTFDNTATQSGATVYSRVLVADGITTGLSTRNLTLANLGYTGTTNANTYVHPTTYPGDDMSVDTGALSGATVISDLDFNVTTDTSGHVTDANATVATRSLTAANIGALSTSGTAANSQLLDSINSTQFLRSDAADQKTSGTLRFNDNVIQSFGTGDDAEFFCNGAHMYIDLNAGIGNLYIRDGTTTRFTFDDAGSFTATGNITAYSDERLKDNIEPIEDAVSKVKKLTGVTYNRKDIGGEHAGLIAQDIQKVLPEAVKNNEDGMLSVDYNAVIGLLVQAVNELSVD